MTEIFDQQVRRYPQMQPQDAVKLLYQQEFGCGHLVTDETLSLRRLKEERSRIALIPDQPLLEPIGNGYLRLCLHSPEAADLSDALINEAFVRSAERKDGKKDRFLENLEWLLDMAEAGFFAFDGKTMRVFLEDYRENGCQPVSHSEIYHDLYHPSYRVVDAHVWEKMTEKRNGGDK